MSDEKMNIKDEFAAEEMKNARNTLQITKTSSDVKTRDNFVIEEAEKNHNTDSTAETDKQTLTTDSYAGKIDTTVSDNITTNLADASETCALAAESDNRPQEVELQLSASQSTTSGDGEKVSDSAGDETTVDHTDPADRNVDYDPKDITYEGDIAVYTNPKTGHQFQWNKESESWVLRENCGSYDFINDTHIYTDKDGITFEWDKEKNAWFPKIDDDFMAHYQMSYGFTTGTTDNKLAAEEKPKVEKLIVKPKEVVLPGQKRKPSDPKWFEPDEEQNTKIYVSNLPLDITDDEFLELMQKCGIIMRDPITNQMKIKLYKEPNSVINKGDGLCTYVRRESVDLAAKLIDGNVLRGKKIKAELAKFQMKGDYNPTLKPKSKKRKEKVKLKKQQEKMFDWRPEKMIGERAKHERMVIVKNVFDSKMFDEDVGLILEFQQDLREECAKCGEVKKVVLYDRHPEGVAQVNMTSPEEADDVVNLLNGRWFGKRKLSAEIWDGRTKYRVQETDSQITDRIGNWDKFLEDENEAKEMEKLD